METQSASSSGASDDQVTRVRKVVRQHEAADGFARAELTLVERLSGRSRTGTQRWERRFHDINILQGEKLQNHRCI